MAIPVSGYPYWATESFVDDNGYPNKLAPLGAKQLYGQKFGQNTTRQDINYMFDLCRQWIQAFDEQNVVDGLYMTVDTNKTIGDMNDMYGGTWVSMGTETMGTVASTGFQDVLFAAPITLTTTHGLDLTAHTCNIAVNGAAPIAVSYTPVALGETMTELIAAVNVDLGAAASIALVGGKLRVASSTAGGTSAIAITSPTLFSDCDGYDAIAPAVVGLAGGSTVTIFKRTV